MGDFGYMKYRVGDKVRIKTWGEMEKEFGVITSFLPRKIINCDLTFMKSIERDIERLNCDRVLTIRNADKDDYFMEEIGWRWTNDMIRCLVREYEEPEPILNRFEILDIR